MPRPVSGGNRAHERNQKASVAGVERTTRMVVRGEAEEAGRGQALRSYMLGVIKRTCP